MKTPLPIGKQNSRQPPASCRPFARLRAGFTLMEVNIALLILAITLTSILSLFPVGLSQANFASEDTIASAFADLALNGMRANAQTITNWSDWAAATDGDQLLGITGNGKTNAVGATYIKTGSQTLADYLVSGQYLQYSLTLSQSQASSLIINASIQVTSRQFASVSNAAVYATSFVYMGM